jgi:hypothetical protein
LRPHADAHSRNQTKAFSPIRDWGAPKPRSEQRSPRVWQNTLQRHSDGFSLVSRLFNGAVCDRLHFANVGWEEIRMFPAFAETNNGRLFYWNLDGTVGLRGANRFDDVMFVQWCLYKASKWDGLDRVAKVAGAGVKGQSIKEAFAKTNVNGACTGLKTDNLVEKITFLQSLISVDMDGRVDPIVGSARHSTSIGGKEVYLIMRLNQILKEVHPREYPRLDLMPEFIWRISDKVKPVFWN